MSSGVSTEVRVLADQVAEHRKQSHGNNANDNNDYIIDSPLKIAVIGSLQVGKTRFANEIAGRSSISDPSAPYNPTAGCRILTFDERIVFPADSRSGGVVSAPVQLWDISGNRSLESCWHAVTADLDGVIVVCDTNIAAANAAAAAAATAPRKPQTAAAAALADVKQWCEWFATNGSLTDGRIIIYANGTALASQKPILIRTGNGNSKVLSIPICQAQQQQRAGAGTTNTSANADGKVFVDADGQAISESKYYFQQLVSKIITYKKAQNEPAE